MREISLTGQLRHVSLGQLHFTAHFFTFPYNNQAFLRTLMLPVITCGSRMHVGLAVTGCRWNSRQALSSPPATETLSMAARLHHSSGRHPQHTMKAQIQFQASPCWILVDKVIMTQDFPSISVFPCQYYSTNAPHLFICLSPTLNCLVKLK